MHLQTLFLNLITNALDAMPQGGTLTIKTQKTPSPASTEKKGGVEISITDTGIGISEEAKKKIFEPFFTTRLGKEQALAWPSVVDHQGTPREVEVEAGGEGSTFVYIPALQGSPVLSHSAAQLLVVDDDLSPSTS
jgi:C4-dicarboxylate-specific signal transduction histidine kinase